MAHSMIEFFPAYDTFEKQFHKNFDPEERLSILLPLFQSFKNLSAENFRRLLKKVNGMVSVQLFIVRIGIIHRIKIS